MFIWDLGMGNVVNVALEMMFNQMVGFLSDFFVQMGNMGVDLFDMPWVQSVVLFFSYLAWTLFVIGIIVAIFEAAIDYQSGRASIKDTAINAVKGFMATSLITIIPIRLYSLSVSLGGTLASGITGMGGDFGKIAADGGLLNCISWES